MTVNQSESESTKTIKIVVDAYATSDHGASPLYAVCEVNQAFLDRVGGLVDACVRLDLTEARVVGAPTWGDLGDEVLQSPEMVLAPSGAFWFTDYPKHSDYTIETRAADLSSVRASFECAEDGEVVFLSQDPGIRDLYAEDEELAAAGDFPADKG